MSMITLSGQQLSAAVSLARWPTQSAQTILGYLRFATVDEPTLGAEAVLSVGPRRLAANLGMSANTVRRSMAWLEAHGVIVCHERGEGSAPSTWSIEGDLTRWQVDWRIDREKALLLIATLVYCAPYGSPEPRIYRAVHRDPQTGQRDTVLRLRAVHRGAFVARPRAQIWQQIPVSGPPRVGVENSASSGPSPFSLRSSFSSSQQQEEEMLRIEETPEALAVLAAVYEVTGHELYDGRHRSRSRVVAAVAEVDDVGHIVSELRRVRPRQWMQAVEMVCRLAKGPAEVRSSGADAVARAASLRRQISQAEHDATERKNLGYPVDDELEAIQNLKDELAKCDNGDVTSEGAIA